MVRAKFWVSEVNHKHVGAGSTFVEVKMSPVYDDGGANKTWSKATPQGQIIMGITNQEAVEQFEIGKSYFVDFTPV